MGTNTYGRTHDRTHIPTHALTRARGRTRTNLHAHGRYNTVKRFEDERRQDLEDHCHAIMLVGLRIITAGATLLVVRLQRLG